jgi:hypothetical protein
MTVPGHHDDSNPDPHHHHPHHNQFRGSDKLQNSIFYAIDGEK